jgi:hypothetical protein
MPTLHATDFEEFVGGEEELTSGLHELLGDDEELIAGIEERVGPSPADPPLLPQQVQMDPSTQALGGPPQGSDLDLLQTLSAPAVDSALEFGNQLPLDDPFSQVSGSNVIQPADTVAGFTPQFGLEQFSPLPQFEQAAAATGPGGLQQDLTGLNAKLEEVLDLEDHDRPGGEGFLGHLARGLFLGRDDKSFQDRRKVIAQGITELAKLPFQADFEERSAIIAAKARMTQEELFRGAIAEAVQVQYMQKRNGAPQSVIDQTESVIQAYTRALGLKTTEELRAGVQKDLGSAASSQSTASLNVIIQKGKDIANQLAEQQQTLITKVQAGTATAEDRETLMLLSSAAVMAARAELAKDQVDINNVSGILGGLQEMPETPAGFRLQSQLLTQLFARVLPGLKPTFGPVDKPGELFTGDTLGVTDAGNVEQFERDQ